VNKKEKTAEKNTTECPLCWGGELITSGRGADQITRCSVCGASWSDGKDPVIF